MALIYKRQIRYSYVLYFIGTLMIWKCSLADFHNFCTKWLSLLINLTSLQPSASIGCMSWDHHDFRPQILWDDFWPRRHLPIVTLVHKLLSPCDIRPHFFGRIWDRRFFGRVVLVAEYPNVAAANFLGLMSLAKIVALSRGGPKTYSFSITTVSVPKNVDMGPYGKTPMCRFFWRVA